nr:response regulator [Calditrichia bacterium]
IGFGLLSSNSLSFLEDHCTAVNLISGSLSAILFQQVFFERIKKRFAGVSPFGQLAEGINLPEAFNGGAMAALLVDRDRRILAGNQRAREQWGTRAEGLSGEPLGSLFGQDSAQNLIEALAEGGGKGPLRPLTLYDRHGAIWDFYPDLRPRGFDNGECLLLGFEVTQWRREEIRRQDENTMRQVVHFSRVMSSYLGDLLTVLTPNVSLLKAQFPKEHELRRHIGFMELSLHQAERVVKQLLNYGLEDIEEPEPLALAELVREWRENLGKDLPENISLKVSGDENLPEVMYFSRRLNRLVRVLVENSAEALPNGGKIAVHLTAKNLPGEDKGKSLLSLVVADNGTGIDPKLRPHIFKPFFSTKVKNEEMGLGLFNAYCIAKDSGGDIQVESEPGKGSVFRITLPAKMVSHLFPETAPPAEQAEAAHPAAGETPLPEASGPVVQEAPLPEADQQEVRAEAPESREGERPDISEAPVEAQAGETSDPQRAENTAEPEEAAESSAEAPEEKRVSPLKAEVQHFEEKPVFTDDPQEVHIEEALAAAEVFSKILPEDLEALAEAGIDPVHQAQNRHGILVVDDEFNIRNMLREILEHRGYTVYTASNGREGVEVYQAHATDIGLVIMDMVMPEMSGKDAFHRIKAEETDPKFLVISGFAKPKEVKEVMQNGADDYMKKPFQLDELVERVEKLLKD